jgi:hypothetical protein
MRQEVPPLAAKSSCEAATNCRFILIRPTYINIFYSIFTINVQQTP